MTSLRMEEPIVIEEKGKLLRTTQGLVPNSKSAIAEIYSPEENYTFLRTIANPRAVEVLPGYVGTRKNMASPWQTRLKKPGDDVEYVPGSRDGLNGLWFAQGLMDDYLKVLSKLVENNLGVKRHASFPLIETERIHSLERPLNFVFWPVVHVIKGRDKVQKFKDLVHRLNSEEAYKIMKRVQGPTAYKMAEVDLLRQLEINPLLVQERTWEVDGETLGNALDFIVASVVRGPEPADYRDDD